MAAELADLFHIYVSNNVDYRQRFGLRGNNCDAVDFLAHRHYVHFDIHAVTLTLNPHEPGPRRAAELRADSLDVGIRILPRIIKLEVLDINSPQPADYLFHHC